MVVHVAAVCPWVGEVRGLDCSQPLGEDGLRQVQEAFREYHVLVFRDQTLTPSEQARFSRQLGELEDPGNRADGAYRVPSEPDVLILSNEVREDGTAVGVVDAGEGWHSDSQHKEHPAKATILLSVKNPAVGGNTHFCNMHLVLAALPEDIRRIIAGKRGITHASKLKNPRTVISDARPGAMEDYKRSAEARPDVFQPLVRTHPETGRQALFVSPRFTIGIEGMADEEAQPLLDRLFAELDVEAYQYTHVWSDRDMVMWDNRCVTHRAGGGIPDGDIRRMHRTVIQGDRAHYNPGATLAEQAG